MSETERAVLASARAQMIYDANRKSNGVTYLLALLFGGWGVHRFYLRRNGTGALMLGLWILGWLTLFLAWIPLGIWVFVDLFLIPGMVREFNMGLVDKFAFD
ncbi:TM2 domain-containing protein [Novosphingobium sp. MW5]|nr:TM2 domain-containing protein [Novosphingobium sp. MW5]